MDSSIIYLSGFFSSHQCYSKHSATASNSAKPSLGWQMTSLRQFVMIIHSQVVSFLVACHITKGLYAFSAGDKFLYIHIYIYISKNTIHAYT